MQSLNYKVTSGTFGLYAKFSQLDQVRLGLKAFTQNFVGLQICPLQCQPFNKTYLTFRIHLPS